MFSMKRIALGCALLLILAGGAFADGIEIGPTAMLRFPLQVSDASLEGIGVEDFKFGGDAEIIFGVFQIGALADFRPGRDDDMVRVPPAVEMLVTGGVLFDLWILRLGLGIGPSFVIDFPGRDAPPPPPDGPGNVGAGVALKGNADLQLGNWALRLNVIGGLDILRAAAAEEALEYADLRVGLSLLYDL